MDLSSLYSSDNILDLFIPLLQADSQSESQELAIQLKSKHKNIDIIDRCTLKLLSHSTYGFLMPIIRKELDLPLKVNKSLTELLHEIVSSKDKDLVEKIIANKHDCKLSPIHFDCEAILKSWPIRLDI